MVNMANAETTQSGLEDERKEAVWTQRCATLYQAWVQLRYHRRRQRFFDLADKLTKSFTVILGASLMGDALKQQVPVVASAIASLGLLALVFGYGDRKQLHKELAELAAGLVVAIEQITPYELTPEHSAGWCADYARLCARAPPPLKTLSLICEREQSAADGHPAHVTQPFFLKRLVADFKS